MTAVASHARFAKPSPPNELFVDPAHLLEAREQQSAMSNRQEKLRFETFSLMNHEAMKLTQAHLINPETLSICFSDGTAALFSVATLLACAVKRIPADDCFTENDLAFLHSSMPEDKLKVAIAENLLSLTKQFSS